ncbi:efflux RND transporter periplasmic adaptor subunit [Cyanobacterium stanieri LEGE 03274]|uniref:Efflux RND transporter periplasmic adaptor subunit n=1 Tax=Cyanobacterium stanieri LEGE 03274 TaxID=1828756 RepID=A0ABR9V760_9CHRO|nr:efflux RND transporter periplasmic adaptor subunit [Cyanobacterium stanieri]MBE9223737.1 efflux RND transporter periplasmic adaptor subunit [Cyanobacterium stanieri LEGE 03274]
MTVSNIEKEKNPLPWIIGAMIGGILLLGGVTYGLLNRPNATSRLDENTVLVSQRPLTLEIRASGVVQPVQSVNISPKNPGILTRLLVDQGTIVQEGQPIAVMENEQLFAQGARAQAQLTEAQASAQETDVRTRADLQVLETRLAQAAASLEEARRRIPLRSEQLRSQLRETESRLRLAEVQTQRNQALLEEGVISQDEFDGIASEYLSLQAQIQEIVQRIQEVETTAEPEIRRLEANVAEIQASIQERQVRGDAELERLQANIQAAQANLKIAEIQFQDTFITAPFDGIVTQKFASEGAFVTPTTSASATSSATSSSIIALARGLEIVAKVPEIDLSQIALGQPVEIVADAYPDQVFQGVVQKIAPEAIVEQNVTSFEVTIAIPEQQEKLLSRMNVEVTFLGEQLNSAVTVPTVAIVTEDGETGVMVPDDNNEPEFRPVTIGISVNDQTQILSGLSAGERVFVDLSN